MIGCIAFVCYFIYAQKVDVPGAFLPDFIKPVILSFAHSRHSISAPWEGSQGGGSTIWMNIEQSWG